MKVSNIFMAILLILCFGGVSSLALAQSNRALGYGKDEIDSFCSRITNKPQLGIQFDGKEASPMIMQLAPGKYEYPNQGALLLFPNKHYLLQLSSDRSGIYGTDGDDLLAKGGIVGGCSVEQLSEAILNNSIRIDSLKLVKPYN